YAIKKCDNNTSKDFDKQFASYILDYKIMRDAYKKDIQTAKATCDTQLFQTIKYCFQVKNYTKNSVNCSFGLTKQEYARFEIWCIDQLADIIDRSAKNNIAINLKNYIEPFRD
ncbi:3652_t:CDS:2, partial [Cetraspora pellucida]